MIPKIYECLSDDLLRPVMCHALITKDETAASNSHILVVHKTSELFNQEFIDDLPEGGILVGKDALKDMALKNVQSVWYDPEIKLIKVIHQPTGGGEVINRYFEVKIPEPGGWKFPDYNKVWPEGVGEVPEIKIKPLLLAKLFKAMGAEAALTMKFTDPTKGVICEGGSYQWPSAKGLIMPMMIT